MTNTDILNNLKMMTDKELAYAAKVGRDLERKRQGFDKSDEQLLRAIEFEAMCRLADRATYEEFDSIKTLGI